MIDVSCTQLITSLWIGLIILKSRLGTYNWPLIEYFCYIITESAQHAILKTELPLLSLLLLLMQNIEKSLNLVIRISFTMTRC